MISQNDPSFKKYVTHVLKWEGLTSKNPNDTASSCAPFPGAVHTNKGVTYCTFREYAAELGIYPVTYDRFLKLTNDDVVKFVWHFMNAAVASPLPTVIALSITEAAWGSGPNRAVKHLQSALNLMGNNLKVDGVFGPLTKESAGRANKKRLYDLYWQERRAYLENLIRNGYGEFATGWRNRVTDFMRKFPYSDTTGPLLLLTGLLFFALQ